MKTKLYILVILSVVAISAFAQNFQPATLDRQQIQSQQIMQTGAAYSGTVYEPFSSSTPSEQNEVGAASGPAKVSGPRRLPGDLADAGNQSEEYPIGDAVLPMMLLACAYLIVRAMQRRKDSLSK